MEQLDDENATRGEHFRHDLQTFLNLQTPLIDFQVTSKVNVGHAKQYPEYMDICKPRWANLRQELMKSARKSSNWIRNRFIKSPDVIVGNEKHFRDILGKWGVDPCIEIHETNEEDALASLDLSYYGVSAID